MGICNEGALEGEIDGRMDGALEGSLLMAFGAFDVFAALVLGIVGASDVSSSCWGAVSLLLWHKQVCSNIG